MNENECQGHLTDRLLPQLLEEVDRDLADLIRLQGCHCGGRLHSATYPRKPRGLADGTNWNRRFSFCCDQDGCRRRATPPSVRFLGRKVYAGFVVVLLAALSHGLSPKRVQRLCAIVPVPLRTLERWRSF